MLWLVWSNRPSFTCPCESLQGKTVVPELFIEAFWSLYFIILLLVFKKILFKYLSHFVFEQLNTSPPPPPPHYWVLLSCFHSQIRNTAPWPTNVRLAGPHNTCFPVGREGKCMSLFWVPCLLILLHTKVCFHCLIRLFPALCLFIVDIISSPSLSLSLLIRLFTSLFIVDIISSPSLSLSLLIHLFTSSWSSKACEVLTVKVRIAVFICICSLSFFKVKTPKRVFF